MSAECGGSGAFGLLLSKYAGDLGSTYKWFLQKVNGTGDAASLTNDEMEAIAAPCVARLRARFREIGIDVPKGAQLIFTGYDDERPGRCQVDEEEWILGFGVFMEPWKYPPMHESFRKAAEFYNWVWMSG